MFTDLMELESLLSHAHGLKELTLNNIDFDDTFARPADPASHKALIVLDSLDVELDPRVAFSEQDAMLSTFSRLDIRHLRSLHVVGYTPLIPLLRVNSRTLQKVRCIQPDTELSDPDILENNTSLHHIDVAECASAMADAVKVFGNLRHLMALQTVSLRFPYERFGLDDHMTQEGWGILMSPSLAGLGAVSSAVHLTRPHAKHWPTTAANPDALQHSDCSFIQLLAASLYNCRRGSGGRAAGSRVFDIGFLFPWSVGVDGHCSTPVDVLRPTRSAHLNAHLCRSLWYRFRCVTRGRCHAPTFSAREGGTVSHRHALLCVRAHHRASASQWMGPWFLGLPPSPTD
ncbi:hypothetical protein C8J57DRAFT_1520559 [Mycena rebaudengoi]|nr:hypothetical protein C8J57DRAFT_1520559 [Mycena rebaudengoi]